MADRDLGLPFFCQKLGGIPMFTFGSSSVLDLDNTRLFAQQFQLEEYRPTLRRIARGSALCHHDLVQCLDVSRFIVRSQNDPDVQYEVVSSEDG